MSAASAELSSISSALEDVAARISVIAAAYQAAERDDLAGELYEAERALASANRRLARVAGRDPA